MILADVTLADGSQKSVAINPDDGMVLKIAMADQENGDETRDGGPEIGETANN